MKKIMMIIMVLLFTGLSQNVSAQYGGTWNVVLGTTTQTQQSFIKSHKVQGANFNHPGDSLVSFCEISDTVYGSITVIGSQFMRPNSTDSIASGVAYIISGLTPGHNYKVTPHIILYQEGIAVWFMDHPALYFTTPCTNPTVAIATSTGKTTICNGNSIVLTASGAESYLWGTGETTASITVAPTSNTTYTVIGANGKCSSNKSVSITVAPAINLVVNPSLVTVCYGTNVTFTASGAGPVTYNWSNNLGSGSIKTFYLTQSMTIYVTATNGGCSEIGSVIINVMPPMNLSAYADKSTICNGNLTQLFANGENSWTYSWSPSGTLDDPNLQNPTATPTSNTKYTVTATSTDGCTAVAASQTIAVKNKPDVNWVECSSNNIFSIHGNGLSDVKKIEIPPAIYTTLWHVDQNLVQFSGVSVNDGDFVKISTLYCDVTVVYKATGIKGLSPETVIVKQGEKISLSDLMGREISVIVAQRDYMNLNEEIIEITNLFNDLPSGIYFFRTENIAYKFGK